MNESDAKKVKDEVKEYMASTTSVRGDLNFELRGMYFEDIPSLLRRMDISKDWYFVENLTPVKDKEDILATLVIKLPETDAKTLGRIYFEKGMIPGFYDNELIEKRLAELREKCDEIQVRGKERYMLFFNDKLNDEHNKLKVGQYFSLGNLVRMLESKILIVSQDLVKIFGAEGRMDLLIDHVSEKQKQLFKKKGIFFEREDNLSKKLE